MKKINLIALSGRMGSGKNTVASIMQYLIWKDNVEKGKDVHLNYHFDDFLEGKIGFISGWEQKAFAAKLKQIASILTGIRVEKFEDQEFKKTTLGEEWNLNGGVDAFEVRLLLQRLGTDAIRDIIHPNAWVNALFADYRSTHDGDLNEDFYYPNWIITDCRFPNEFEAVKQRGGICIRVERPNMVLNDHVSETALDNHQFDYIIQNTGTIDDLVLEVENMLKHFKLL